MHAGFIIKIHNTKSVIKQCLRQYLIHDDVLFSLSLYIFIINTESSLNLESC